MMISFKISKLPVLCLFVFSVISHFQEVKACTVPDNAGTISGKNTACRGQKVILSIPAIGFATSYKWTFPAQTQIISGANKDTITVIFFGSGGYIRVQGVNSCDTGVSSSFFITVNSRPNLTLIAPQKYCCDYGNIALGSSTFGSPSGGTWTCRQNSKLVSANVFLTSDACSPLKSGVFTLTYNYQDPSSACANSDSTKFTINPLPAIALKGGSYCQDKMEAQLKKHILAPINLNSLADVKWRLLKSLPKRGGGMNTVAELIYDRDPSLNYDFWLKFDTSTIDLGTSVKDSLILEMTIQNGEGCFNKDTVTIHILKVPKITFSTFPEICINTGKVNLTKISNAKPLNGCWNVINNSGYNDSIVLKPGMINCDTLNTYLLSLKKGPGLYWMRYIYSSGGCAALKEMALRIHPLPNVSIGLNPNSNQGKYCETDTAVRLNASPAGGNWNSSISGILSNNTFKPASLGSSDRNKWIVLTYSYTHPITKCDTAKSLSVFVQSKPRIKILTQDTDTCRSDTVNIKLSANYSFTSKISWVHSFDASKASFENNKQLSNNNPSIITIRPPKDRTSFFKIFAFTEAEGVCPFMLDSTSISIDSTACDDSLITVLPLRLNQPFEIVVFPNPGKGPFNIEIKKAGEYVLKFYSIEGKLLLEKAVSGFILNTIDQKLSSGIYTLVIEGKNGYSTTKKLLVN